MAPLNLLTVALLCVHKNSPLHCVDEKQAAARTFCSEQAARVRTKCATRTVRSRLEVGRREIMSSHPVLLRRFCLRCTPHTCARRWCWPAGVASDAGSPLRAKPWPDHNRHFVCLLLLFKHNRVRDVKAAAMSESIFLVCGFRCCTALCSSSVLAPDRFVAFASCSDPYVRDSASYAAFANIPPLSLKSGERSSKRLLLAIMLKN